MLTVTMIGNNPRLEHADRSIAYADLPYEYTIVWETEDGGERSETLAELEWERTNGEERGVGFFRASGIRIEQTFQPAGGGVAETIRLTNPGGAAVRIGKVRFGFTADLGSRAGWRLCAIPFKVQLDGSRHDYGTEQLLRGEWRNAAYVDTSREEPVSPEEGLRSEAWAWGDPDGGIVAVKYNKEQIEYAMAGVDAGERTLRFGGAGLALYGEPSGFGSLQPGEAFAFGQTFYFPYGGDIRKAFGLYRAFLESRGHTFAPGYNPPVNWNVLYDIGWHHSDPAKLKEHYHKEAVLQEAAKAKACGCELLYLDPGWEVAEGLTLWDESRLGKVSDLAEQLKDEYGLELGYRTVLRAYRPHWDEKHMVRHSYGLMQPERMEKTWGYHFWEMCLCDPDYYAQKLRRIVAITGQGVRFMMFDEMDWRGPCYDPNHGHPVPSTAFDHIEAVYRLASDVRAACPGVLTEVHDPVWPWTNALYAPTYFRQGAPGTGSYDENWGFEYMWNCIEDLKTGKALALYYYNLGCSIPLYLHITMAADNDACVFFWWAASTVRHLGIGGKTSHPTVELAGGLEPYDKEARFESYCAHMQVYHSLKPYFVRGTFHGLAEHLHLHTLADRPGGVVNVFNLSDEERELRFAVSAELIGAGGAKELEVEGAEASWNEAGVELRLRLPAMSPGVVAIGEAALSLRRGQAARI